ncbi:MAG: hypothetical protein O9972_63315 [Burkholderiales bacterium]|nr:hypothetical protein [Burkholderiales bacterium]
MNQAAGYVGMTLVSCFARRRRQAWPPGQRLHASTACLGSTPGRLKPAATVAAPWPNVAALIETGEQITIGAIYPIGCATTASEADHVLVMLRRREGETLTQMLDRLDAGIAGGMGRFAFDAPPTRVRPMQAAVRDAIVAAPSIPPDSIARAAELDNGPVWQAFWLASAVDVLALDASLVRWPAFRAIGVVGPQPTGSDTDREVRMLARSSAMSEDPITGSLNAAIARWRHAQDRLHGAARVAQGTATGVRGG